MINLKCSLVLLLTYISEVVSDEIYFCRGLCSWDQTCCGYMVCCDEWYIWRIWYFWFLLILGVLMIASCGAFCCYRRNTVVMERYRPLRTTVRTYEAMPTTQVILPAYSPPAPPPVYTATYKAYKGGPGGSSLGGNRGGRRPRSRSRAIL